MKTQNIISTPDITGNIGTCNSQSIRVDTDYNIIKQDYKTVVTNSCTGQVTEYNSWELGAFPWVVIILGIMIMWVVIGSNSSKSGDNF